MAKQVKMSDIGKRVHVSTVTVSKALSGQKGVSDSVREEIIRVADEMGYIPIATRKLENEKKSYNIGILIHETYIGSYTSFYGQLHQRLNAEAMENGNFSLMEEVTKEMEDKKVIPVLISEKKVDGIIIIGKLSRSYQEEIRRASRIPIVFLDYISYRTDDDCIISDSYYGAYSLTDYLMEKGHRKIGFVGTLLSTGSIDDRYFGYRKAMMEGGAEIRNEWLLEDRNISDCNVDSEKYFILPKELPTAFVCNCDITASLLIQKLERNGIHVPGDVSVVGYDNFLFPQIGGVDITTYEVDIREMAHKALRNLMHKLNGEYYRKGIVIVSGHIVEKESVKDINI